MDPKKRAEYLAILPMPEPVASSAGQSGVKLPAGPKSGVKLLEGLGLRNIRKSETKASESAKPQRSHGGYERNPRVLLVLFRTEQAVWKSLRNLGERVQISLAIMAVRQD